jgi:glyceraldehyde-3-phosphate dehydrogenase/erythrose-4-phosphate dehydrogenase
MYLPSNVKQAPGIKSASIEGFTFLDDSSVKADALIYCTGRLTNSEMGKMHINKGKKYVLANRMGMNSLAFVCRCNGKLRS